MAVTGYHRVTYDLVSGENPVLAVPILKDNMKRFLGNLIQDNVDIGLAIDLGTPVVEDDETEIWQEVFVAKIRPVECEVGDLLYVSGPPPDYFRYYDMMFSHRPDIRDQIYERIG